MLVPFDTESSNLQSAYRYLLRRFLTTSIMRGRNLIRRRLRRAVSVRRGASPYDVDALAAALVDLSKFAACHADDLESAEINPLRVLHDGQGVVGLDAVVITRTSE